MGKGKVGINLILCLAVILRLVNLGQSFWLDEGAQALMSQKPFLFQWFGRGADFQPPLFSLIIHFWMKMGTSEWFLRLPSVFFGVATIYLTYLLGNTIFNRKTGLLAAFFLAVAPYHIYYSQELRPYSLLAFLATASMFFLFKRNWSAYILATTALLYSSYMGLFLFLAQGIWVLAWQKTIIRSWLKSISLSFFLFLPWLPQFLKQFTAGQNLTAILPEWGKLASLPVLKALPLTFVKFSLGRVSFNDQLFYTMVSVFVLLIFGFVFYKALRKLNKEKIFCLNWFLTPMVTVLLVSFFVPMFQPFRLLFVLIPFYLFLAIGVLNFSKRWQPVGVALVLIVSFYGLLSYYVNPEFQREDWRRAVQLIESQDSQKSVAIFEFSQPFAPYQWYARGQIKAYGVLPGLKATPRLVEEQLPKAVQDAEEVYLFQYLQPLTDPDNLVSSWLGNHGFEQKEIKDFSGVGFVYNYIKE